MIREIPAAYREFFGVYGQVYKVVSPAVFVAVGVFDYDYSVFVKRVYRAVAVRHVRGVYRKPVYRPRVRRYREIGEVIISFFVGRKVDFLHGVDFAVYYPYSFTRKANPLRLPELAEVFVGRVAGFVQFYRRVGLR